MGNVTSSTSFYATHGAKRERAVTVTLSASYAAGGDSYTERLFGLLAVQSLRPTNPSTHLILPDLTNKKFQVFQQLPTGTTEVPAGVDLSGISFKASVIGY